MGGGALPWVVEPAQENLLGSLTKKLLQGYPRPSKSVCFSLKRTLWLSSQWQLPMKSAVLRRKRGVVRY
jgi:hypothetical protein